MTPRNEPEKTDEVLRDEMKKAEAALAAEEARAAPTTAALKPTIPISINYDELHIDSLDCQFFEDLSTWFEPIEEDWRSTIAAAKFESDNEEEQASMANPSDEDEAEQPKL